jgi:hypothetical protein
MQTPIDNSTVGILKSHPSLQERQLTRTQLASLTFNMKAFKKPPIFGKSLSEA